LSDRILVTGGAGFIGSHLVERLMAAGQRVICVDNFDPHYPRANKLANVAGIRSDLVEFCEADILDEAALADIFAGERISTVVHLAARPGVRPSLVDPNPYVSINVQGTLNVLRAAAAHPVDRIVFASSSSVYGSVTGKAREDRDAVNPLSPYAASKVAGEAFCNAYQELSGITTVMLRFFTAYGPRQRPDMAIAKFVDAIEQGREITLFGDGKSKRDYTYVDDVVDGVMRAITADLKGLRVFNLGSSRPVQLLEMVNLIEERLGKKAQIRFAETGAGEPEMTFADIGAAEASLGYSPRIGIEEGLTRFVKWFREGSHAMAEAY
jgi:UDP-glucuronate 4-epimerase